MAHAPPLRIARIASTCYNVGVYEPSDDSFALVDALRAEAASWAARQPAVCAEIGCGSGYVICSAALMLQDLGLRCACLASDLSPHALTATRQTLEQHGVGDHVDLVQTDLLAVLAAEQRIDLLLFNPPYVVTPDEEVTRGGIASAWAGGRDGRIVIDRLLAQLPRLLSPVGVLYMILVEDNRPQEIIEAMRVRGFDGALVLTRRADEELLHVLRLTRSA